MYGSSEKTPSLPVSPPSATSAKRVSPSASPDPSFASASWSPSPSMSVSSSTPHLLAYLKSAYPDVDPKVVEAIGVGCDGNPLKALDFLANLENGASVQVPCLDFEFEGVLDSAIGPQPTEQDISPRDQWVNKIIEAKDKAKDNVAIEKILIEMLSEGDKFSKEVIRALIAKENLVSRGHKQLLKFLSNEEIKSKKLEEELHEKRLQIEKEREEKNRLKAIYEDEIQYLITKVEQSKLLAVETKLLEEQKKKIYGKKNTLGND